MTKGASPASCVEGKVQRSQRRLPGGGKPALITRCTWNLRLNIKSSLPNKEQLVLEQLFKCVQPVIQSGLKKSKKEESQEEGRAGTKPQRQKNSPVQAVQPAWLG